MRELKMLAHTLWSQDPWKSIVRRVGDASFVLLGEASHGTHEFYRARAQITRRLIEELGFSAVVVEADWPDAYRVNRYVRGAGEDPDAASALGDFARFPTWMWRNSVVRDFVEWLRDHNEARPTEDRVGFYGMDLYSLHASMTKVLEYLAAVDPEAASRARNRYACFDHVGAEGQEYGYAASLGLAPTCEQEVLDELVDLYESAARHVARDGFVARDEQFFAEQNARLVKNAEAYYRAMFGRRINTWNLRDSHMVETVRHLRGHLDAQRRERTKLVIWAHNSHVQDARFTERAKEGEHSIGQLMRDAYGSEVVIVGFTTHQGVVTAASDWDGPLEVKRVRPALEGSWERLLHDVGVPDFSLVMDEPTSGQLFGQRLNRAIGVIYRPETERWSHYFSSRISKQFDALVHFDETTALRPLELPEGCIGRIRGDLPETFPRGF